MRCQSEVVSQVLFLFPFSLWRMCPRVNLLGDARFIPPDQGMVSREEIAVLRVPPHRMPLSWASAKTKR